MNTYDIGDTVRITNVFTTQATGAAVDPTTIALTLMAPDGTETTYTYAGGTVTKDSTGTYHVDVSITASGDYRYRWVSTGTGAAAEEGRFQVRVKRVT